MDILKKLSNAGYRKTKTRKALVDIFEKTTVPLSASELQMALTKKGFSLNRTTVYRELWFLKKQGIVKEVFLGEGKSRFELSQKECHHHLVCTSCGKIEDVQLNETILLKEASHNSGFQIKNHSIEFFGMCVSCQ